MPRSTTSRSPFATRSTPRAGRNANTCTRSSRPTAWRHGRPTVEASGGADRDGLETRPDRRPRARAGGARRRRSPRRTTCGACRRPTPHVGVGVEATALRIVDKDTRERHRRRALIAVQRRVHLSPSSALGLRGADSASARIATTHARFRRRTTQHQARRRRPTSSAVAGAARRAPRRRCRATAREREAALPASPTSTRSRDRELRESPVADAGNASEVVDAAEGSRCVRAAPARSRPRASGRCPGSASSWSAVAVFTSIGAGGATGRSTRSTGRRIRLDPLTARDRPRAAARRSAARRYARRRRASPRD